MHHLFLFFSQSDLGLLLLAYLLIQVEDSLFILSVTRFLLRQFFLKFLVFILYKLELLLQNGIVGLAAQVLLIELVDGLLLRLKCFLESTDGLGVLRTDC